MKTPLLYGCLIALVGALLTFGLYFAGFHETPEKFNVAQQISTWVGLAAGIIATALAMRERRNEYPADRDWGYSSALGVGVLTAVVAALIGSILGYLYFGFVNPNFPEIVAQAQAAKMAAKGMSEAQIDGAMGMIRRFSSPAAMSLFNLMGGVVGGVIISLIIAIFFRKRPTTGDVAHAVPPSVV